MANNVSSTNLTGLYGSNGNTVLVAVSNVPVVNNSVSSKNLTTLYSGSPTIVPSNSGGGGNGTANITILDEGNVITSNVASMNFTGGAVVATAIGNAVTINISGGNANFAANANYANFAGNAFSVNVANVVGIGNIAVLNLDGNASNILYGNGVFATVPNTAVANFANYAGNVTVSAQPNITSVGTLVNLSVSGNITSGNANLGNLAIANFFSGNGSLLTGITTAGNSNFANFAGNVTNSAQPNITSVGTLVNLSVSGNITSGNANLGNLVIANYFSGDGSLLSNINGGNVTGNVTSAITANFANYAGNVTNAAQPNITSVGTLVSLSVTGNITSGNANLGNLVIANYFSGDGSLLSNINGANVSNVANANYANFAGNVTNSAQPNITSVGTLVSLDVTGNITSGNANLGNLVIANFFSGDGSLLSNINGSNVSNVANANFAAFAGNVTNSAQPNITSVGTLTSLDVTGNISSGNANLGNLVIANFFSGDGSLLSNINGANVSNVANANYANFAGQVVDATQSNITQTGNLVSWTVNANVANTATSQFYPNSNIQINTLGVGYAVPNGFALTTAYVDPTLTTGTTSEMVKVVDTSADGSGASYNRNYYVEGGTSGNIAFWSNEYFQTLNDIGNGATDPIIPGYYSMSFYSPQSDLATGSNVGTSTSWSVGNPGFLVSLGAPYGTSQTAGVLGINHYGSGATGIGNTPGSIGVLITRTRGNGDVRLSVEPNDYVGNISWRARRPGNPAGNRYASIGAKVDSTYVANTAAVPLGIEITTVDNSTTHTSTFWSNGDATFGNIVNANFFVGDGGYLSNINGANVSNVANANYAAYAGDVVNNAQPNITSVGTLISLDVTGNISSGNANLGNLVIANFFSGDGSLLSNINGANVSNVANANYAAYAGNVVDNAQPNITSVGTLISLDVTGNISSGNANLGNLVVANFFSGDGSLLSNINGANVSNVANANFAAYAGNVTVNAQPNITSLGNLLYLQVSNIADPTGVIKQNSPGNIAFLSNGSNTNTYQVTTVFHPNNSTNFPGDRFVRSRGNATTPTTTVSGDRILSRVGYGYNGNVNLLAVSEVFTITGNLNANANALYTGGQWNMTTGYNSGDAANATSLTWQNSLSFSSAGTLAIVPGSFSTSAITITNYGLSNALPDAVGGINQQKARGNRDAITSVLPNDTVGRVNFYGYNGAIYQSSRPTAIFGQVDSSYVANATIMPLNMVIRTVNSSNVSVDTTFFGNSLTRLPGNINFNGSTANLLTASTGQIALGVNTGTTSQGNQAIAIGLNAGQTTQSIKAIAIGSSAGTTTQGQYAIAIGDSAGSNAQGQYAVAIGGNAGAVLQNDYSIAIGQLAGNSSQSTKAIAIGGSAGTTTQGQYAVAIGDNAGSNAQGQYAVAIGGNAGAVLQNDYSIAIGILAGNSSQGGSSIAIGRNAGQTTQGANSIAIGFTAGFANQANNSIILNATGSILNQTTANTFTVKPVRNVGTANLMFYDNSSGEITYDLASNTTVGNANYAAFAGNVTINAQPNITSVGTLTSLVVSGNTTTANLSVTGTANIANLQLNYFQEKVYNGGNTSGTITPDFNNGSIQTFTLTGAITLNSLANSIAGRSMTLVLTQDASGSRTLASTMSFAGGNKTLSTTGGAKDIISVFYDGTTYYATLTIGYA